VPVPAYEAMQAEGPLRDKLGEILLSGVSTRKYERVVPEMATSCGISKSSVSRQFKAVTDQSPMMYFTRRRIAKAAELMLQPGARIKEVARLMGYDNPFSFSRQFKAVTGLSPRLWLLRQADAGVLRGS